MFEPHSLAAWAGGRWTGPQPTAVRGFTIDSRNIRPGEMFVALRTERRDGHDFLAAALAAGASGALVMAPQAGLPLPQLVVPDTLAAFQTIAREHRRRFSGPVIAITGSAGKTSTKEMLARLLGETAAATEGNLNNHLGVPLTLTALQPARHQFAVVEAGISAPGEMRILTDMIEPDVAVVTMVGPAHLDELGGIEGVAREKAALMTGLRPGGVAIFPSSCWRFEAFRHLGVPVLDLDFSHRPWGNGREIELRAGAAVERYFLPAASTGMAENAALALRVGRHLGVPTPVLRERLASWTPAPQRGEVVQENGRLFYLDYYNANPASMLDALAAFERVAGAVQPRLFLIGCMEELGREAERFHRELGAALPLRPGDQALVVGPWAEAVRQGAGDRRQQIAVLAAAADAAPIVANFTGAIFVKGSRKHRLETALREPASVAC